MELLVVMAMEPRRDVREDGQPKLLPVNGLHGRVAAAIAARFRGKGEVEQGYVGLRLPVRYGRRLSCVTQIDNHFFCTFFAEERSPWNWKHAFCWLFPQVFPERRRFFDIKIAHGKGISLTKWKRACHS